MMMTPTATVTPTAAVAIQQQQQQSQPPSPPPPSPPLSLEESHLRRQCLSTGNLPNRMHHLEEEKADLDGMRVVPAFGAQYQLSF
jgi:hypothetical protein